MLKKMEKCFEMTFFTRSIFVISGGKRRENASSKNNHSSLV